MKKLYTTLLTLAIGGFTFAQNVPNSSFETWSGGKPVSWSNSNYITQSTDAHSGTYAVKGEYTGSGTPFLSVGSGNGAPTNTRWNYVNFYYKFNKTGNAAIDVSVYFDNPNYTIGSASSIITTASAGYKAVSIPVSYNLSGNPTDCTIEFSLTGNSSGAYFIIDDVTFSATPLGVNDIGQQIGFTVFPNPAKTYLKVELERSLNNSTTVQLLDVTGRQVIAAPATAPITTLTTENLPAGMYYVAVKHNGIIETKKVFIE